MKFAGFVMNLWIAIQAQVTLYTIAALYVAMRAKGDPATAELSLCALPCDHAFHTECVDKRGYVIRGSAITSKPLVCKCPLCRRAYQPDDPKFFILGDLDVSG